MKVFSDFAKKKNLWHVYYFLILFDLIRGISYVLQF